LDVTIPTVSEALEAIMRHEHLLRSQRREQQNCVTNYEYCIALEDGCSASRTKYKKIVDY
jgi:hypothetical protein